LIVTGLVISGLGLAGLLLGSRHQLPRVAFAHLTAFAFATSIAAGALLLLMLGYTINAGWMSAIRRIQSTLALAIVPLVAMLIPLLALARQLYVWTRHDAPRSHELEHVLAHNRSYLDLDFFTARALLYFLVWMIPAWLLRRWSIRRAELPSTADPMAALSRERALSSAMLLPATLAMTFAAFDWLMSLEPTWFSAAYGLYYLTGGSLAATSVITIVAHFGARSELLRHVLTPHHFHALGRVLFSLVILWAYVGYFQVFLVFIADKPREVTFYLVRTHGTWNLFGPALAIGHFAIPVLLLVVRAWKFHSGFLAAVSAWLVVMHYADLYYLTMPVLTPHGVAPHWLDLAALMMVAGVCLAFCALMQRGIPLLDVRDPLLPQGLHYRSEQ
jgi:hypothetical protein